MSKIDIMNNFKVLAQLFKKARKLKATNELVPGKDPRRQVAYQNAASAVCVVPGERFTAITVVNKGRARPDGTKAPRREVYLTTELVTDFKAPPGLGAATTSKILEQIETGQMVAAQEARRWLATESDRPLPPRQMALRTFQGVFGVGSSTASQWLELYERIPEPQRPSPLTWVTMNSERLPTARGKIQPLSRAQKIGLKYYHDLKKRIPRRYITVMQLIIRLALASTFGVGSYRMKVAGSYRRGMEDSGDIDIILTSKKFNLSQAVKVLKEWGIIVETLSLDKHKFTGISHCPSGQWFFFHLDLVFTTESSWDAALLYFTGSKGFNTMTRNKAKEKGLVLNQYGLFDRSDKLRRNPIALNEKEILRAIGQPYIEPECR